MNTKTSLVTGILSVSALFAPALAAQGPETVQVGSKPSYSFNEDLMFGQGVSSLADLRGKPTMIEFWGTA